MLLNHVWLILCTVLETVAKIFLCSDGKVRVDTHTHNLFTPGRRRLKGLLYISSMCLRVEAPPILAGGVSGGRGGCTVE